MTRAPIALKGMKRTLDGFAASIVRLPISML